jgi:hypothetical protein
VRMRLSLVLECLSYAMNFIGYHGLYTNPTYTPK